MIDCHTHLVSEEFDADREQVLQRALAAGLERIVVVGQDLTENRRVLELCAAHPEVLWPCLGLHPDRFRDDDEPPDEAHIEAVCALAREHATALRGIGEVGLDHWQARTPERRALQRETLERMVALALELELPLNVHCRSAGRQTLEALAAAGAERVLMHAYDGKVGHAMKAADERGWVFSIPPSVVRSTQKQKLVRRLPLEALALETDSPVLGPSRDERNEPANIIVSLETIAELKRTSQEAVREVTTANALRVFGRAR